MQHARSRKPAKKGIRHPLLLYRRTMDRVSEYTLILGLFLGVAGGWPLLRETYIFGINSNIWLLGTALLSFAIGIFAFLTRLAAYVQVTDNTLNIVTPFIRLKISFRRIQSFHPVLIQQIFPSEKLSWAARSYLSAFNGKTALMVELHGYPINPAILRIFWTAQMFSPQSPGLVLLVSDWMKLSTEFDSFYGSWMQGQGQRGKPSQPRR
jgi:hypothetical protein